MTHNKLPLQAGLTAWAWPGWGASGSVGIPGRARPLCAGGCHHEVFVRYGDTGHANLHYCDWIRQWTDTCLHIYGELAVKNPGFLEHFAERKGLS